MNILVHRMKGQSQIRTQERSMLTVHIARSMPGPDHGIPSSVHPYVITLRRHKDSRTRSPECGSG